MCSTISINGSGLIMRSDLAQPVVGPLAPGPLQDQVLDLAATSRSGLSALLGDAAARHALFRRGMRADRFLVATVEGELAGYLSLKYTGHGPFAPSLGDFLRCYGAAQGAHAFAVYRVIEAWSRPRPGGAYIYGLDVLKPWRGHRRGRDVGGALIEAAIAATARLGLRTLDLEVRRPAARAFFLRMGAVPVTAPRLSFT
ncbi:MAG: GNAT family N-acetyltransferase, partial [Rubrivivax sp.]|nr:GNAT family N-acetyltransferase [Rubrivivax sp.]